MAVERYEGFREFFEGGVVVQKNHSGTEFLNAADKRDKLFIIRKVQKNATTTFPDSFDETSPSSNG